MPLLKTAQQQEGGHSPKSVVKEIAPHKSGSQQDPPHCEASRPGDRVPLAKLQYFHYASAEEHGQGVFPGSQLRPQQRYAKAPGYHIANADKIIVQPIRCWALIGFAA